MAAHSTLMGGSIAWRRINCNASYALEEAAPEPPVSSYAQKGTMLHSVMQHVLDNEVDPMTMIGFTEEGQTLTVDDVQDLIQPALDDFDRLLMNYDIEEFDLITEASVQYRGMNAFGTCDVIVSTPKWLIFVDWKFGKGVLVKGGAQNAQLKFYAGAARETPGTKELFQRDVKSVVLAIIQPPAAEKGQDSLTFGEIFEDELDGFVEDVRAAVKRIRTEDNLEPRAGKWCRFCNAAPTCPAKLGEVQALLTLDPKTRIIDPIELGSLVRRADEMETWIKAVRSTARNELQRGRVVDGFKLAEKRATRKWIDEDQAENLLIDAGVALLELHDRKLVSPRRAERLLKTAGGDPKAIEEVVTRQSSGTTMVPEDDPRPAITNRRDGSNLDLPVPSKTQS
jgi:hypothetical protein